jgi:hypothetical protein
LFSDFSIASIIFFEVGDVGVEKQSIKSPFDKLNT